MLVHKLFSERVNRHIDENSYVSEDIRKRSVNMHTLDYFGYSETTSQVLLGINIALISSLLLLTIVFACYTWFYPSGAPGIFTTFAFSEYFLFMVIVWFPAFHVLDIYQPIPSDLEVVTKTI